MDLKAKIDELWQEHSQKAKEKQAAHKAMVEIRKKISKYETVLKHAQEIESLEEKEKVAG